MGTMKRGELCELVCRSEYAYGSAGSPPKIPPNATLVFEVELFDWKGKYTELTPGLRPANERHRYKVTHGLGANLESALIQCCPVLTLSNSTKYSQ